MDGYCFITVTAVYLPMAGNCDPENNTCSPSLPTSHFNGKLSENLTFEAAPYEGR
jgi:hypothetical protein